MNLQIEVKIVPDIEPISPREWDNYGIMACSHRRYNLGDEQLRSNDFTSWEEVREYLIRECEAVVILPLMLYDHSGLSISTRSFHGRAHHAEWDSGQVGFIYTTRANIKKMQGWKYLTKERLEKVESYLRAEVEEYDTYLRGDVWGYQLELDGEPEGSCYGYFGLDCAKKEAISEAVAMVKHSLEADLEVSYA